MTHYVVKAGDTLGRIARKFYGEARHFHRIVTANRIVNPDRLRVGQKLAIPDPPQDGSAPAMDGTSVPTSTPIHVALSPATVRHNDQRLAKVHPAVAARARTMVDLCARAGISILVTQGYRSVEEQNQLYEIGRTRPPIGRAHIVTKARGGHSWHNFGLAFDIVVLDSIGKADWDTAHPGWGKAAVIGKSLGLEWGGDWRGFKDLPHFQYTGPLTLPDCRRLIAATGLQSVWDRVV